MYILHGFDGCLPAFVTVSTPSLGVVSAFGVYARCCQDVRDVCQMHGASMCGADVADRQSASGVDGK